MTTRTAAAPPGFPASIPLYPQPFRNWTGEVSAGGQWTCAPVTAADVVTLANWARSRGWRLRPLGRRHNWSPLIVRDGSTDNVVLVDTTRYLTSVRVRPGSPGSVTAQAGVTMDALLGCLESAGQGLAAVPALGDLSLGGVLAIAGHGTGVPPRGRPPVPGQTFGSISDLVISLTAVVWDPDRGGYTLRTFERERSSGRAGALMAALGRAFVVEATLRTGPDRRLRCVSRCDFGCDEVFAPPASAGPNSFAALLERHGALELLWYPFTPAPWIKCLSVTPRKPPHSREVTTPYNFPFTDTVPRPVSDLVKRIVTGESAVTPAFCRAQLASVQAGLTGCGAGDLWGWSKNLMLYVRSGMLRFTTSGYAVLTRRADVQRVVGEFYTRLLAAIDAYRAHGAYPVNGPLEIRVTGLDGAPAPHLSPLRPCPDHPQWDVAVWLDVLTLPGTPHAGDFYREIERWMLANFTGDYALVRPEWSKGWAYTDDGAWTDGTMISTVIPAAFRESQAGTGGWDTALADLHALDPHGVFGGEFLDTLLRGQEMIRSSSRVGSLFSGR